MRIYQDITGLQGDSERAAWDSKKRDERDAEIDYELSERERMDYLDAEDAAAEAALQDRQDRI